MLRRAITLLSLLLLLLLNIKEGIFIFAEEAYEYHSESELPFILEEDPLFRENLLDQEVYTPSEEDDITTGELMISTQYSLEDSFMTVLAEKRQFDLTLQSPTIIPLSNSGFLSQLTLSPSLFSAYFLTGTFLLPGEGIASGSLFQEEFDTILSQEKGKRIETKKRYKKEKYIAGMRGKIQVEVLSGTVIQTLSGDIIDASLIDTVSLENTKIEKAKKKYEKSMKQRGLKRKGLAEAQVEGFEFGLSGTHLIFSKPVMFTIRVPHMSDGHAIDLLTLHAGDSDFHTGGLSVDPMTGCDTSGNATIPGSQVIVTDGKITFYTCGASSFTMNPSGGTAGSNDLRLVIGDCAQTQIYYNNLSQVYTGNPPATGCSAGSTMDSWPVLRIGGTSYGNDFTAWSTNTTTGTTVGNNYTATTTMTRVVGGLTYTLIIDWSHTAPNKYLTWSWRVIIPATNTNNVRFYYGMDSAVAGGDTNDVGYLTSTGGLTFGVYDSTANVLSAFRYMSGQSWTAYESGPYNTVRGKIAAGTNFANTITPNADLGYGVNWDFGTTPGTYSGTLQWTLAPYVAGNVPDLIPGIGAPEGPLTTNLLSQYPITVSNIGNLASSGVHTVVLTIPTNIIGPASGFSDNGWSCGAQVGTGVTCTKTTILAALTGSDSVRIPVTPTTAASGANVTFNVFISNPGDSNLTNNTAFSTNPVIGAASIDPGGITGENLWLQSGTGTNCIATGCTVSSWLNRGGLGVAANAVTGLGTVTYDPANRINGHATIYFNGASLNTNNNLGLPTVANSIFVVSQIGAGGNFYMGTQTVTNNTRSWRTSNTTDGWMRFNSTLFYSGANSRSTNTPAITSTIRQAAGASAGYTNGRSLLTSATVTAFTVNNFGIGRVGNTNSTLSRIAEVIIYPTAITLPQKNQVESYLAIKYGLTLDQTTQTSYTYSNGSVVWSSTGAGIYRNNIAGIGRDDTSTLDQRRSQSVTNTGDIVVAKSFIGTNRQALTWAHDGGQIGTFTGTDSELGFQRMSREWLFQEKNGDMGTVTISYMNGALGTGFVAPLMLLVDDDGIFSVGASAYTGTYNTGSTSWDFSLNIADMQYIAFAKRVPTDTTSPSITSVNISSGTLIPSSNFSFNTTYTDTGSAINTGTIDLRIYSWNSTGGVWNGTDISASYATPISINTSSSQFQITNLPFGRYRFELDIQDSFGNLRTGIYTYFIDDVDWTVSAPLYAIGNSPLGADTFGAGELIVTIQTVGAGIDLRMLRTTDLTYISDIIPVYNSGSGWGYSQWNGVTFPLTITPHGTEVSIANVAKNINQNGLRNTFTYRIKYGVNPNANTPSGDYSGLIQFGLNLTF